MDQSSPDFFAERGRNRSRSVCFPILDTLTRSGDIRDRSLKLSEIYYRAEFCMFWAPNFFGGRAPEFLDLHYKAHPDCDQMAKFHGDRPRELADLVGKNKKEKKTSAVKHNAFGTNVPGGLISRTQANPPIF